MINYQKNFGTLPRFWNQW